MYAQTVGLLPLDLAADFAPAGESASGMATQNLQGAGMLELLGTQGHGQPAPQVGLCYRLTDP